MVSLVYSDLKNIRDYSFRDQMHRCAFSVMNNIAEGFSRDGDKEFHRFLTIAKGSCGELKSMYYLAEDLNYLNQEVTTKRKEMAQTQLNRISVFMKYLRQS